MAEEELEYLDKPIAYLQDEDFDSEGNLRIRLNQGYTYPEGISS